MIDPWGEDDEEDEPKHGTTSTWQSTGRQPRGISPARSRTQGSRGRTRTKTKTEGRGEAAGQKAEAVPTLQSFCVATLAQYLGEVCELPSDVIDLIAPQHRAALLAVGRHAIPLVIDVLDQRTECTHVSPGFLSAKDRRGHAEAPRRKTQRAELARDARRQKMEGVCGAASKQRRAAELGGGGSWVYRRQNKVTNKMLWVLVSEEWNSLDVASCKRVSVQGLCRVLRKLRHLTALDVTGLEVSVEVLNTVGCCCPGLQTLRLGSGSSGDANGLTAPATWRRLLPVLEAPANPCNSWEDLAEDALCSEAARSAAGGEARAASAPPRLQQLRWIVWRDIPASLRELIRSQWPGIGVNATPESHPSMPREARIDAPLDQPLVDALGRSLRVGGEGVAPPPEQHIAERFRIACETVTAERAAKWEKKQRRMLRSERRARAEGSAVYRAVHSWLDEC